MAKKRVEAKTAGSKRYQAVKDSLKKRTQSISRAQKFKNAELKTALDSQTHLLYQTTTVTAHTMQSDLSSHSIVQDLTAVLHDL
ncbi:hypothetical protein C8R42DRAFT_450878 [Lentinula raphanica]|nr:hypothetical protein C8R42DRAFT_450878 [Lentinula raphanica]